MLFGAPAIKAGIHISPPFVIEQMRMFPTGTELYSGMAIDLWTLLEMELGIQTEYIRFQSMEEMLLAAEKGDIDVIVSNLSVTYERTKQVRFIWPWYDGGLRIMICHKNDTNSVFTEMKQQGQIASYLLLFCGMTGACFVITLIRRKVQSDFPQKWRDGIAYTFYDVISVFSTKKIPPSFEVKNQRYRWLWHIFSALWMLGCVGITAYITSTITAAMTSVALSEEKIDSVYDLEEKKSGVLAGGPAEILLRNLGIPFVSFNEIEDASSALCSDIIDAVIADAPVLEYQAYSHPKNNLAVVGEIFNPEKYAFGVSLRHKEFADRISTEIIRLIELGKIEELRSRYFGRIY